MGAMKQILLEEHTATIQQEALETLAFEDGVPVEDYTAQVKQMVKSSEPETPEKADEQFWTIVEARREELGFVQEYERLVAKDD